MLNSRHKRSFVSVVPLGLGCIQRLFTHSFDNCCRKFAILKLFVHQQQYAESKLWNVNPETFVDYVAFVGDLSQPLVVATEDNLLWYLNVDSVRNLQFLCAFICA